MIRDCAWRLAVGVSALAAALPLVRASAQGEPSHHVAPLEKIPSEQWIEVLSGDPAKEGSPFVLRLHNDAGYVVMPHTHPVDENIVIIQGTWGVAMGSHFDRSKLEMMNVGDFVLVPKSAPHYAWAKTEMIEQVHGIGPFSIDPLQPLYELTERGVGLVAQVRQPRDAPPMPDRPCFSLKIGDTVEGTLGRGRVVGGQCTPAERFTQYWVQRADGTRFWATLEELRRL